MMKCFEERLQRQQCATVLRATLDEINARLSQLEEPDRYATCLKLTILKLFLEDANLDKELKARLFSRLSAPDGDLVLRERFQMMFELVCSRWTVLEGILPVRCWRDFPCTGTTIQDAWAVLTKVNIKHTASGALEEFFQQ